MHKMKKYCVTLQASVCGVCVGLNHIGLLSVVSMMRITTEVVENAFAHFPFFHSYQTRLFFDDVFLSLCYVFFASLLLPIGLHRPEDVIIWTASSEFGTYRLCEQRRFRRACASAQSQSKITALVWLRQEE